MPSHDPRAIANTFTRLNGRPLSQMKLQKLVYLAHGWNLAISKEPLVDGRIEAWDGGPVMRPIWDHLRDFGVDPGDKLMHGRDGRAYEPDLTETERMVIQQVWRRYSGYTGFELSEMTHQPGTPWSNSYYGSGRNTALSQRDIQQHFTELALAGRQQTA